MFKKNGQTVNIETEINRLKRQLNAFATGVNVDLSYANNPRSGMKWQEEEIAKKRARIADLKQQLANGDIDGYTRRDIERSIEAVQASLDKMVSNSANLYDIEASKSANPYSLELNGDNDYILKTPEGSLETSNYGTKRYSRGDRGAEHKLDQFQGQLDALKGYDDSLSHATDNEIEDLDRVQQNYSDLEKYNREYDQYKKQNAERQAQQRAYDNKPFFMKWGKERPEDIPEPQKPEWRRDKNGEYDGYFRNTDPASYDADKEKVRTAQQNYQKAFAPYKNRQTNK